MATIVRGSDRKLRIIVKTTKEEPLNLTNCTAIKASFLDENGEAAVLTFADEEIAIIEPKGAGMIETKPLSSALAIFMPTGAEGFAFLTLQ